MQQINYRPSLLGATDRREPVFPRANPVLNSTLFSSCEFIRALSCSLGADYSPLAISVEGSGPRRTLYATQKRGRYWSRYASLAPFGLYASPGWTGELDPSTVEGILRDLMGPGTRGFVWNVRFDHHPLAAALGSLGLTFERIPTRVVDLTKGYEQVSAAYSATIRNHVRKARRRGVLVRPAMTDDDVHAYYEVHMGVVRRENQRGGYGFIYPIELLFELRKIPESGRLFIAECEGRIIGGAMFLRDGCSAFYFHGASDRAYSHLFSSCAVFDDAIRWACESGATFVNLTDSGGITSLEQFKASWGASRELNWRFEWKNPLWVRLSDLKARFTRIEKAEEQQST